MPNVVGSSVFEESGAVVLLQAARTNALSAMSQRKERRAEHISSRSQMRPQEAMGHPNQCGASTATATRDRVSPPEQLLEQT